MILLALCLAAARAQDLPDLPPVDAASWRPEPTATRGWLLPADRPGWVARADLEWMGGTLDYLWADGERVALLGPVLRLDLGGAWQRGPLGIAATLPAVLRWQGAEASGSGLGDPGLDLRLRPLPGRPLGLAFTAGGTLPLGGAGSGTGEAGPTGSLGLVIDGRRGPLGAGVQAAARFREAVEVPGAALDDQLLLRGGLALDLRPDTWLSVEVQAGAALAGPFAEAAASPVELVLAAGHTRPSGTALRLGGGFGLVGGIGAPAARVLLGVGQAGSPAAASAAEPTSPPASAPAAVPDLGG